MKAERTVGAALALDAALTHAHRLAEHAAAPRAFGSDPAANWALPNAGIFDQLVPHEKVLGKSVLRAAENVAKLAGEGKRPAHRAMATAVVSFHQSALHSFDELRAQGLKVGALAERNAAWAAAKSGVLDGPTVQPEVHREFIKRFPRNLPGLDLAGYRIDAYLGLSGHMPPIRPLADSAEGALAIGVINNARHPASAAQLEELSAAMLGDPRLARMHVQVAAAADQVTANPDRHLLNMLVDPRGQWYRIDHEMVGRGTRGSRAPYLSAQFQPAIQPEGGGSTRTVLLDLPTREHLRRRLIKHDGVGSIHRIMREAIAELGTHTRPERYISSGRYGRELAQRAASLVRTGSYQFQPTPM